MGLSYKTAKSLYSDTIKQISRSPKDWASFLDSSSWNFEYDFGEQLLIYAQKPNATACATIQDWNDKVFRWVKRGAKGITILRFAEGRMLLDNVFDISDTYQKHGKEYKLWKVDKEKSAELIETLEARYGDLMTKTDLSFAIIASVENCVEDNLQDYFDDLLRNIEGSSLEKYSEEEIKNMFSALLKESVIYSVMKRCDENPDTYIRTEDFTNIQEFNTIPTITIMGTATSEIRREIIREIRNFVRNSSRTFDNEYNREYLKSVEGKDERSDLDDNIRNTGGLSDTQHSIGEPISDSDRKIREDEREVFEGEQEGNISDIIDDRGIGSTLDGNTADSRSTDRGNNSSVETEREYNGGNESNQSDEVGRNDEQLEDDSGGDSAEGTNLQLDVYNQNEHRTGYVVIDSEINRILSKSDLSRNNKVIEYFSIERDRIKKAEFIKTLFDNVYYLIDINNTKYGYKAFDNGVLFWRGNFLTRDRESFESWEELTYHYDAMILLKQMNVQNYSSSQSKGQLSLLDSNEPSSNELEFTQEFLEEYLKTHPRDYKYRVYQQFIKSLSEKENTDFIKDLYGLSGSSSVFRGSGVGYDSRGKGLTLYWGYFEGRLEKLYSWSHIQKTIADLIKRDEYLTEEEKAYFEGKTQEEKTVIEIVPSFEKEIRGNKLQSFNLPSESKNEVKNQYVISDDRLGEGTPKERYKNNLEAIKTLKECEREKRLATKEEQDVLAKYVGWGGLSQAFDNNNEGWKKEYEELKELLTPEEYTKARESTLTAFYTPPTVIKSIYEIISNMGLRDGNILEPSCGIGNFIGLLPAEMSNCKMYGVELDSISGRIAQQLYQKSTIAIQGYETTDVPDAFFDIAVSNVPFGDFKLTDKRYDKNNFLIHDYFFAKTLDKVRPNGVIAFITSKGTLDKENPSIRRYIAQRADLLGAIRLPDNTFKGSAGTEVTTDIIFLQKREKIIDEEPEWVHLGLDENGIKINQYFIDNPQMVLGEMKMESSQFGMTANCKAYENSNLEDLLKSVTPYIRAELTEYEHEELIDEEDKSIPADLNVKNFSYTIVDEKIYYRNNSRMYLQDIPMTSKNRIKELIKIRDSVRRLIDLQTDDREEIEIESEQQILNSLYDKFVEKYGRISSRANNTAFSEDSSYYLLCSLEIFDEKGNFVRKADMFSKRTIKPHKEILSVESANEALIVSISEKANVDLDYMSELSNKTKEELIKELRGIIFKKPYSNEEYVTADEYLSGNVREKLRIAEAALQEDESLDINIEELKKAIPKDLTASEITAKLGSTWIPVEDIEEFMYELLGTSYYRRTEIRIHYSDYTSAWRIQKKSYDRDNVKVHSVYGTSRVNAYKIIEDSLNLKNVKVFDTVIDEEGRKQRVLNKKETAIAQSKQEQIKQAFEDWIWKDPERREKLVRLYNEKFNSIRPREYDGSNIEFGGMNPEFTLRKHQVNAIARVLYGGNTLLAHEVGAGKTFEMVASAMESKRLGLCNKSLFVVPNHIIEQFASEFLQLYPSSNLLVATKKDFSTNYRKRFCSKIATGDYDAIIIGHSQFEKIPMSEERQRILLNQQLHDIEMGIVDLKESEGERYSIKELERSKKKIEEKLKRLNDQSKKDDTITFEQMGVDRMFVDEAHNYKNLFLYTKMRNVGGIAQTEAQKSSDLFMKCRYLDELTGNKGVVFATGTPVSNSMVELYTMQRYLQYDTLVENDLQHFDSWASTFGETVTAIELSPEGTGYRAKTRFAKFHNLPELMSMFRLIADIQTSDTLNLPVPQAEFHNVVVKPSEFQKNMVEELGKRAEMIRSGLVPANVDNMLKITNDGRKLALDQRIVNEILPDFEDSKINTCANNVFDIWTKYGAEKMSQLVFCDISTPKDLAKSEKIFDELEKDIDYKPPFIDAYTDLKCKLMKKGIPRDEIAFIHEADNEIKKKELFAKVRSGVVRVLIGSTSKMGAGTNVQTRLIALHDLDCPWRPADLIQRLGRLVRQGNLNKLVFVLRYVTEGTFDAYLYQLVENKQKFISQIMTSKTPVRSANDVDETALSYAEIKALAAGNPLIIEKTKLDSEVTKLKLLKQSFLNQKYFLEDKVIKYYPDEIAKQEKLIENLSKDKAIYDESKEKYGSEFPSMIIKDVLYIEKEQAGESIINCLSELDTPAPTSIGTYRGFDLQLMYNTTINRYQMIIKNNESYTIELGSDIFGNITRIENALGGINDKIEKTKISLEEIKKQFLNAKEEIKKEFPQEDELKQKMSRLTEVNKELQIKEKDDEIIEEVEEKEEVENCKEEKNRER